MTFDDGNASDLYAAEQLRRRDLHGKFFLLTGRFGQSHYVPREEARDLTATGSRLGYTDTITSTGGAHPTRSLTRGIDCRTFGAPPRLGAGRTYSVALPFGAYNRRVVRRLRGEKFARVYTSDEGPARAGAYFRHARPSWW